MGCRTGCPTQDHESWGACLRGANVKAQWLGGTGVSYGDEKVWNRENAAYANAVKDGLNPTGVSFGEVRSAYRAAEAGA